MNMPATSDYAVHSDFLIHWTGKDIDQRFQPDWNDGSHLSKTCPTVDGLYLSRLRDIVTYGLWMSDEGAREFKVGTSKILIPATPQCCFTVKSNFNIVSPLVSRLSEVHPVYDNKFPTQNCFVCR